MIEPGKDDPFKERNIRLLDEEIQHLHGLQNQITNIKRRIETTLLNETDPKLQVKYEDEIEKYTREFKQIEEKLKKAYADNKALAEEKQQGEDEEVNDEPRIGDSEEFFALVKVANKQKSATDNSEADDVDNTSKTVEAKSLFKQDEPIENTVLYAATFFLQLSPHEFDIVVSFLLKEQPPLSVTNKSQITTENGEIRIVETQEKKPLIEIWKNSLNQPDKFLGKCYLKTVPLEDSSVVIDFSLPHLRKELKDYLEEHQPLYVESQFKRVQLLLFSSSPKIATSAIELTIKMAINYPEIYRENWLLAIILELTEEADWNIDNSLKAEQKLHKLLLEIESEQRRNIILTRISFLIYKMLNTSQLKGVAEKFIERLISEQRYDAVLAIVKDLYSVQEFSGLYWIKQLLDRGNGEIRADAYKFLFNRLKQSGSHIYEMLESIQEWLPSSNRSPESYSRSNEYALQLLVEYCLETTSKLDEKYYGDWPSKYQLFAPLQGSEVETKIAIVINWLLHPDNEGNLALEHIVDRNINPIEVIGGLIADWFMILWGLEKKEPAPKAAELVNKLLQQVIQKISRSQQKELLQSWVNITDYFLSAYEVHSASGNLKLSKKLNHKRNLVRLLIKQFKALQTTNQITKQG